MPEELYNILHSKDIMEGALPSIIDVFASMYSVPREVVEEKFSKMHIVSYYAPEEVVSIIESYMSSIFKKFANETFNDIGYEASEENYNALFGDKSSFEHEGLLNIKRFESVYELYLLGPEGRSRKFYEDNFVEIKKHCHSLTIEQYVSLIDHEVPEDIKNALPGYMRNNISYWFTSIEAENNYRKVINDSLYHLSSIVPGLTEDNFEEFIRNGNFKLFISFLEKYDEFKSKYDSIFKPFREVYDKNKAILNKKSGIEQKYFFELIKEFDYLLPEKDKEEFNSRLAAGSSYISIPSIYTYFGYGITSQMPMEYFSSESEEILNDPNQPDFQKDTIKNKRISFFNDNGINLGYNYEDYVNDEQCKKLWPSFDLVAQLEQARFKYIERVNEEYCSMFPSYQENRRDIDALGLLDKDDSFRASAFTGHLTCINPNIRKKGDAFELFSLMMIYYTKDNLFLDKNIIHELNHLWELSLLSTGDHSYLAVSGWDIIEGEMMQDSRSHDSGEKVDREYELFNEIINEILAQQMAAKLHEQGVYMFNTPDKHNDYGGTGYQRLYVFAIDFFEEYRDAIMASRRDGNYASIYDTVGKENFDALNSLINEFYSFFPEGKYNQYLDNMENENHVLTQKYREFLKRKDMILANMATYKESKVATL